MKGGFHVTNSDRPEREIALAPLKESKQKGTKPVIVKVDK